MMFFFLSPVIESALLVTALFLVKPIGSTTVIVTAAATARQNISMSAFPAVLLVEGNRLSMRLLNEQNKRENGLPNTE
jgi:hypothetical protein